MNWYDSPEYKTYSDQISQEWGRTRELESKIKGLFRDIFSLSLSRDLIVKQTYELESIPSSHNKSLEKYTTDCAECWFYNWSHGEECIQAALIDKAVEIGRIKLDIDTIKAKIKVLNENQSELAKKLREKATA